MVLGALALLEAPHGRRHPTPLLRSVGSAPPLHVPFLVEAVHAGVRDRRSAVRRLGRRRHRRPAVPTPPSAVGGALVRRVARRVAVDRGELPYGSHWTFRDARVAGAVDV